MSHITHIRAAHVGKQAASCGFASRLSDCRGGVGLVNAYTYGLAFHRLRSRARMGLIARCARRGHLRAKQATIDLATESLIGHQRDEIRANTFRGNLAERRLLISTKIERLDEPEDDDWIQFDSEKEIPRSATSDYLRHTCARRDTDQEIVSIAKPN